MASAAIALVSTEADRSDGALVEAHLDGDSVAFDALYRRHQQRLVRFCWKQTHDLPLAEDLAQEAMIRYLQNADTFDTSQPMWPWLKTIARNLVIDHYRRTSNDPHLDPDLGSVHDGSNACTVRLDRIEAQSELRSVLAALPERQRVALRLHHEEDWTTADVADYFDIKVNACKQLLYRARQNARQYYEELAERTEASFSIVFVYPILLALRKRFRRSHATIETLATDVAGLTIALDAVAERAAAALAVVVTIALGGVNASYAMEPASATSQDVSPVLADVDGAFDVRRTSASSDGARPSARPPAEPARHAIRDRSVQLSSEAGTQLPATMSGEITYKHSANETTVHQEDQNSLSLGGEVTVTISCDGSGVTYDAACTAVGLAGETVPDDSDGSPIGSG